MCLADGHGCSSDHVDCYDVLGVPFEASGEEIRRRYHKVVRTVHPDRQRSGEASCEEASAMARFHDVQKAWYCLSEPRRRLLYDLQKFGRSSQDLGLPGDASPTGVIAEAPEARLLMLQKQKAECDVLNMELQLKKVLRHEKAKGGVVIKQGLYGVLRLRDPLQLRSLVGACTIQAKDLVGPVIDVTLPLQSLVEKHALILPGGVSASKAKLPGFFHPAPLNREAELCLYVLYEFRGALHEVLVGDREALRLPLKTHALPEGALPRGPLSPSSKLQEAREGRGADRPRAATKEEVFGLVTVGATLALGVHWAMS